MKNIENVNYPAPKQEYKVLVRCITYNQKRYIEDALNGFAMQQTNFPFVCLVMDDASTDGEQEVIKKWMECECDMSRAETIDIPTSNVIIVPHKTNLFCTFAFYLLKQNLYEAKEKKILHVAPWRKKCEYEALCEGDDYWINSLKLQKQVEFLDANSEYSMCFHNAMLHYEDGAMPDMLFSKIENKDYSGYEMFQDWIVATASVVARKNVYESFIYNKASKNELFIYGDIIFFLSCANEGRVRGLKEVMSVYRKHNDSVTAVNKQTSLIIKKRAYHNLEIYKVFGAQYEKLSKKFFARDLSIVYKMEKNMRYILSSFYITMLYSVKYFFVVPVFSLIRKIVKILVSI